MLPCANLPTCDVLSHRLELRATALASCVINITILASRGGAFQVENVELNSESKPFKLFAILIGHTMRSGNHLSVYRFILLVSPHPS